ncbi:hypothetical protein DFH06DRAFT_1142357 [Mycena polygramma]|nr:hypothetical protein DFH06DRAFT_1142357 [Mycena polygramma]
MLLKLVLYSDQLYICKSFFWADQNYFLARQEIYFEDKLQLRKYFPKVEPTIFRVDYIRDIREASVTRRGVAGVLITVRYDPERLSTSRTMFKPFDHSNPTAAHPRELTGRTADGDATDRHPSTPSSCTLSRTDSNRNNWRRTLCHQEYFRGRAEQEQKCFSTVAQTIFRAVHIGHVQDASAARRGRVGVLITVHHDPEALSTSRKMMFKSLISWSLLVSIIALPPVHAGSLKASSYIPSSLTSCQSPMPDGILDRLASRPSPRRSVSFSVPRLAPILMPLSTTERAVSLRAATRALLRRNGRRLSAARAWATRIGGVDMSRKEPGTRGHERAAVFEPETKRVREERAKSVLRQLLRLLVEHRVGESAVAARCDAEWMHDAPEDGVLGCRSVASPSAVRPNIPRWNAHMRSESDELQAGVMANGGRHNLILT